DCRPINIVEDGGLTEVIRIASGDNSYDLPSRGTIVFKKKNTIKQQFLKYTLSEVITSLFIRISLKKKTKLLIGLKNKKMRLISKKKNNGAATQQFFSSSLCYSIWNITIIFILNRMRASYMFIFFLNQTEMIWAS